MTATRTWLRRLPDMRPKIVLTLALLAILGLAVVGLRVLKPAQSTPATTARIEVPPASSATPTTSAHAPARAPDATPDERVARYQQLRARLALARDARLAKSPDAGMDAVGKDRETDEAPHAPAMPRPPGSLDKEYIQKQMQEIVPLFAECYDMALETEPQLQGRVVIETKLIGEEEVGGLIESSEVVVDQSDIVSPHFLECVRETMYALELDAPESGGSVVIRYPLQFHPGEEDGPGDDEQGRDDD